MALTNKLSAIGDAIRGKTGKTDLLTLDAMVTEINDISVGSNAVIESLNITSNGTYNAPDGIDGYSPIIVSVPQDGAPTETELTFTSTLNYTFAGKWKWFIDKYKNQIKCKNIVNSTYIFYLSDVTDASFDINWNSGTSHPTERMFYNAEYLTVLPNFNNFKPDNLNQMFYGCQRLRNIPENWAANFDWSRIEGSTSNSEANMGSMFYNCYSLRKVPENLYSHINKIATNRYNVYYSGFYYCYALEEILNLPIYCTDDTSYQWTANAFSGSFGYCCNLKRLTFKTKEDGTPYSVRWKNQTIALDSNVGYGYNASLFTSYNSGMTADKEIKNAATYEALKNDPDSFATTIQYSKYNHDSAVETINSLPDTSEYLASAGGTNTIQFKSGSGSNTDGGGTSNLTAEEIAVATAKGWTVSIY